MLKDIGFWNEQGEYIPDIQEVSEVEIEDKEIIIDGVDVAGCVQLVEEPNYPCGLGGECEGWENCYYKQLKRLEQVNKELIEDNLKLSKENAKQKDMIEKQWKLLEQCGVSAGGELKRVSYLIGRLRDENKLNMSSVFNLSIELQKALDENAELKAKNEKLRFPQKDLSYAVLSKEEFEGYQNLKQENERLQKLTCFNCGEETLSPSGAEIYDKILVYKQTLQEIKEIVSGDYETLDPQALQDIRSIITKAESEEE